MKENNLKKLFLYSQKQDTKIKRGIIYSILNKLFDLAPPVLIGVAIDIVVEGSDSFLGNLGYEDRRQQLIILAVLTFIIWGLESTFDYVAAVTWRNISQDIEHKLRTETFNNVLGLDLEFFENKSSGRLMAILNDDVNQLEKFLDTGANKLLQTITTVVVIGGTFIYISPLIAIFAFIPIPIIIFGSFRFTKTIAKRYTKIRNTIESLNANLSNSLTGILTVKSFNREKRESERINKSSEDVKAANYHAIRLSAAFIPIIRIAILFGFTATLLHGGIVTLNGGMEVASYSVMIFMMQRLLWPLTRLGETFDLYQRAMVSTTRVLNLLETEISVEEGDKELDITKVKGEIRFDDVNFAYPERDEVISNLSLAIKPGSTQAIVGSTGSGKTTLIRLLLRFHDPSSGSISLDGDEIKDLKVKSLRSSISLVTQTIILFPGTVMQNIAYGRVGATEEEIITSAKIAEAHDFIMQLPHGYDTQIGEGGHKLSGGQRQRLSIARAVLKDAPILVLDEATSSVDNETEEALQKSLEVISKDRTTIVIAHRLSTIRHSDSIIVLDDGKVIESGTHEELLDNKSQYSKLWNVQTGQR